MRSLGLAAAGLFTTLVGVTPAANAQTVAYYRFEDGTNGATATTITDSGPNGLNGISAGTTTLAYTANIAPFATAGLLALDATDQFDFARVNHNAALEVQGDLTVETFFRLNTGYTFSGDGVGDNLVAKQNNPGFGNFLAAWSLDVVPSAGQVQLRGTLGFGSNNGIAVTQGSGFVAPGVWNHAALVLDRDVSGATDFLTLYLNGIQVSQSTGAYANLFYGTAPLYIGAGNYGSDPNGVGTFRRNFNGQLDEVRITAAALSPGQFLNASAAAPEPGALALLTLPLLTGGFLTRRRR